MDNSILSQSSCWSCRDHAQTIISDGNSYPKCTKVFHITSTTGLMLPQKLQRVLLVPWGLMLLVTMEHDILLMSKKDLIHYSQPSKEKQRKQERQLLQFLFHKEIEKNRKMVLHCFTLYSFIFHMFTIEIVSVYLLESSFFYLGQTLCHLHTPQL